MTPVKENVLVTGADGFIGRHLCRALADHGYEVRGMKHGTSQVVTDRVLAEKSVSDQRHEGIAGDSASVSFCYGDLLVPSSLQSACAGVTTVYHLAGIAHVGKGLKSQYQRVIVEGTRRLLVAAIEARVKRLVYFSSSLAGTGLTLKSNDYGEAKLAAEKILLKAHQDGDIEVVILRPVNVYGPGMKGSLATMMRLIMRHRLPPLPLLENRISLIGVKDLCEAALLCGTLPQASGHTYVVTDGTEYGINAIESAIYTALDSKKPGWHIPRVVLYAAAVGAELWGRGVGLKTYKNLVNDNLFDNGPLVRELGFKPASTLFDQLPAIIAALRGEQK